MSLSESERLNFGSTASLSGSEGYFVGPKTCSSGSERGSFGEPRERDRARGVISTASLRAPCVAKNRGPHSPHRTNPVDVTLNAIQAALVPVRWREFFYRSFSAYVIVLVGLDLRKQVFHGVTRLLVAL